MPLRETVREDSRGRRGIHGPASAPDYFGQALNDDTLEFIYVHRAVSNCDSEYTNKLLENRIDGIRPCCRCFELHGRPLPREPH